MELPFRSPGCPTPDTKKQQQPGSARSCAVKEPIQPQRGGRRGAAKASYGPAHKIRMLRAEVSSLEEELRGLQSKWIKHLPDKRALFTAQYSAHEKYKAGQSVVLHDALKDLHLQQQFMFASIQSAIFRSPLYSSGEEILKTLHFSTQLASDPADRNSALMIHKQRSLAILPSYMDQVTRMAVDKAQNYQTNNTATKSVLPISQIDITGCKDCTLVTSVFMSEIPHTSLEEVFAAVLAYFDSIPTAMRRHFGAKASRTRLNDVEASVAYWRSPPTASDSHRP